MTTNGHAPTPNSLIGTLRPDDVLTVRFHATKFRTGYDEQPVDDFLDLVVRALTARWSRVDAGAPTPSVPAGPMLLLDATQVRSKQFPSTTFRQGYRPDDVDQLMEQIASTMERLDAYLR
jgi:DivIVA domain-containing protein